VLFIYKVKFSKSLISDRGRKSDSTKGKIPYNHHDLPGYQKQFSCQTRPRKLSYSADDLNYLGIDDTNVEQIISKRPETIFNIHERLLSHQFNPN
jgi:hypothetical protein